MSDVSPQEEATRSFAGHSGEHPSAEQLHVVNHSPRAATLQLSGEALKRLSRSDSVSSEQVDNRSTQQQTSASQAVGDVPFSSPLLRLASSESDDLETQEGNRQNATFDIQNVKPGGAHDNSGDIPDVLAEDSKNKRDDTFDSVGNVGHGTADVIQMEIREISEGAPLDAQDVSERDLLSPRNAQDVSAQSTVDSNEDVVETADEPALTSDNKKTKRKKKVTKNKRLEITKHLPRLGQAVKEIAVDTGTTPQEVLAVFADTEKGYVNRTDHTWNLYEALFNDPSYKQSQLKAARKELHLEDSKFCHNH